MASRSVRRPILFAAALTIAPAVRSATAQTAGSRPTDAGFNADSLMVWASLALGPSVQVDHQPIAGSASLWATYHSTAFAIRRTGTSDILEPGTHFDTAVLYGRRVPTTHVVVVGIGVGISGGSDHSSFVPLPNETVLAFGAEADLAARFAGIGLSAFGTVGQTRKYGGIGLTLALGRLR